MVTAPHAATWAAAAATPATTPASAWMPLPTGSSSASAPTRNRTAAATAAGAHGAGPAQSLEGSRLVVPEWVKDAVFYQVFPDRFDNGDLGNDPAAVDPWGAAPKNTNVLGGDLEGVTRRMGYLTELGVNALYLNPVFTSPSNHKYDTADYTQVDQAFGGNAALRDMVDAAHGNGVKVILDGVFNHVSQQHEWFRDVREKGPKSQYFDRFDVRSWPIRYTRDSEGVLRSEDYHSWWDYATLPVLRTDNPAVRDYFLTGKNSIIKRWVTEGKIDGWRMDVADDTNFSADYWRTARTALKSVNPDAYLVAENWKDASAMLQGDQFDGAMNYQYFQIPAKEFFAHKTLSVDDFVKRLANGYSPEAKLGMFNVLESHDTPRFITEAKGDWYRLRPAAIFQMTYVGAPVVYYGTEIGMEGAADPDSRRSMEWQYVPAHRTQSGSAPASLTGAANTAQDAAAAAHGPEIARRERADKLFSLYQRLIATRKAEPALRRGDFSVLATHNEHKTLVYRRSVPGTERDAIVALNNDVVGQPVTVPLAGIAADGTTFTDALSGRRFVVADGRLDLGTVDGNFGAVLLRNA